MIAKAKRAKTGLVRISDISLSKILASPENDKIYRPIREDDPEIIELAKSIRDRGLLEPLVLTGDYYIVSGHRRFAAAKLAGLKSVPARVLGIRRIDDHDEFIRLLREHNRQREKSNDERLREEVLTVDPDAAYTSLIEHRKNESRVKAETMSLGSKKKRAKISKAKRPMLDAIIEVLEDLRPYWPVSERKVHYKLFNRTPRVLRHASKPDSQYENNRSSSSDLSDMITRARLAGEIPWGAIGDETRPRTSWDVHETPRAFIRESMDGFLKGYWRNLQQTQPNHLHIFVEKNTVYSILRDVAAEFCIPITSGRGFVSHEPIYQIAKSYRESGKEKLVLLVASDFDPSGECIAESFCRSLRDDYEIDDIIPVKFALTHQQVQGMDLPPSLDANKRDSRYKKFVAKYGTDAYELEAVDEAVLQGMLREAIDSVIDITAFNLELEAEKQDAAFLQGVRQRVHQHIVGLADE